MVIPHFRGPCLVGLWLWYFRGGSGSWFILTSEGLVWWGFRRGDGSWFFLTFEGLVKGLPTAGNAVHVGGGLVEDLHIVDGEVHDGEGLVVDLHAVRTEVHDGGRLVEDLVGVYIAKSESRSHLEQIPMAWYIISTFA